MKRLVASRKLQRNCLYCNKSFKKGDVYYKHRVVTDETYFASKINLFTSEHLICARCEYKKKNTLKGKKSLKRIALTQRNLFKKYGLIFQENQ